MRRTLAIGLAVTLAALALWFVIAVFPRLTQEAAQEALPPVLAGGPTAQHAGRNIVTVEGRIARIDTAASGALRLTLRGVPDTSLVISAALDSGSALARTPLPAPGTLVRIVGVGAPGTTARLGIRQVLSLEIRE